MDFYYIGVSNSKGGLEVIRKNRTIRIGIMDTSAIELYE